MVGSVSTKRSQEADFRVWGAVPKPRLANSDRGVDRGAASGGCCRKNVLERAIAAT